MEAPTLLAVLIAWVPFRAGSLSACAIMARGLIGLDGVALPRQLINAVPALSVHPGTP